MSIAKVTNVAEEVAYVYPTDGRNKLLQNLVTIHQLI